MRVEATNANNLGLSLFLYALHYILFPNCDLLSQYFAQNRKFITLYDLRSILQPSLFHFCRFFKNPPATQLRKSFLRQMTFKHLSYAECEFKDGCRQEFRRKIFLFLLPSKGFNNLNYY